MDSHHAELGWVDTQMAGTVRTTESSMACTLYGLVLSMTALSAFAAMRSASAAFESVASSLRQHPRHQLHIAQFQSPSTPCSSARDTHPVRMVDASSRAFFDPARFRSLTDDGGEPGGDSPTLRLEACRANKSAMSLNFRTTPLWVSWCPNAFSTSVRAQESVV